MKKLLVLSLVLLLGVACMAKSLNVSGNLRVGGDVEVEGTVTFADLDIVGDLGLTGNAAFDGTTMLFDGSTSVRNVSAGFTSLEAAANRFGVNATVYMSIATAATTGITTITHTGSAPAVTWTADSLAFVGNLDVNGTTTLIDGSTSARAISAGFISSESSDIRFGYDATDYMKFVVTQTSSSVAITHTGTATVTWTASAFDFVGGISLDGVTISGVVSIDDTTDATGTTDGSIHTDGGMGIAKKLFVGTDLDVDGITNLDVTDIDDTLNVQGVTTHQTNVTVATATNAGALFISTYNIVYTQTASAVTICTLPANAYVSEVKVMTTTAFDDSGTVTCDIGWSGTLEGYAGDLDIKAADGWAYADVYTNFGLSSGGATRDILMSIADQNDDGTAGAATVYIEWTLGVPGSL